MESKPWLLQQEHKDFPVPSSMTTKEGFSGMTTGQAIATLHRGTFSKNDQPTVTSFCSARPHCCQMTNITLTHPRDKTDYTIWLGYFRIHPNTWVRYFPGPLIFIKKKKIPWYLSIRDKFPEAYKKTWILLLLFFPCSLTSSLLPGMSQAAWL